MKKILFLFVFTSMFSALHSQATVVEHSDNFVVGLTKASGVELGLIKIDFSEISKISSAEFIPGENLLLVKTDPAVQPALTYSEVETVLLKYFNVNDIYPKDHNEYYRIKDELYKHDKFILK